MKSKMILIGLITTLSLQAQSFSYTEYVNVERSKPVYKNVTTQIPYKECWDERVPVKQRGTQNNHNETIGTIIGGVAGGVLGHQIGKGRGNTAATVGGAIIGSIIGNNISKNDRRYYDEEYVTHTTKRKCVTKYKESNERRFDGYKNVGFYKGKKIVKFSEHKLHSIPITVTIDY